MRDYGIEVLAEGTGPITADICFVHGLSGHRINTWSDGKIMWPRDLLPEKIPNARIMTFGYESNPIRFLQQQGTQTILSHAQDLLQELKIEREDEEQQKRPIIFVGHSMGGLIIKQAMCKANEYASRRIYQREAKIVQYCTAMVFMGTPHRGADTAAWATTATRLAKAIGKAGNDDIVASLKSGSPVLQSLNDTFAGIQARFNIVTALEGSQMHGIGQVVLDHHAKLDIENESTFTIQADHSDMCKFASKTDNGYRKISGAIKEQVDDATTVLELRPTISSRSTSHSFSVADTSPGPANMRPQTASKFDPFDTADISEALPSYIAYQHSQSPGSPQTQPQCKPIMLTLAVYQAVYNHVLAIEGPNPPEQFQAMIARYKALKRWSSSLDVFKEAFAIQSYDNNSRVMLGKLLWMAAYVGDEIISRQALADGADPNFVVPQMKDIPLHAALTFGHTSIVRILMREGASLYPLLNLTGANEQSEIRVLLTVLPPSTLQAYIDVRGKNSFPSDAVLAAAECSQPGVLSMLEREGFDISKRGENNATVLHLAARHEQEHIVRYLLDSNFPVNVADDFGQSPLFDAIIHLNTDIVDILLQNGAKVNVKDKIGQSPVHVLLKYPQDEEGDPLDSDEIDDLKFKILASLRSIGASLEITDDEGNRPIHIAIKHGLVFLAAALLFIGADPDARDRDEWTPLHLCALGNDYQLAIAGFLVDAGASMKARLPPQSASLTPIEVAKRKANGLMVNALRNAQRDRGLSKFLARRGIV